MANRATGDTERYTAQVIFMTTDEVAGEVEAWQGARGIKTRSELHREIYLAGLKALRPRWVKRHGELSSAAVAAAVKAAPRGTRAVSKTSEPVKAAPRKRAAKAA